MSEEDTRHPLDDCPDCGEPMELVLEVLGGPEAHGGGAFRFCEGCHELYARAGTDRRWLDRRAYRMLAREILRLRALVPPEQRDGWYVRRSVAEVEAGDPALPANIGEAAERNRRQRELGAGSSGEYRSDPCRWPPRDREARRAPTLLDLPGTPAPERRGVAAGAVTT